MSLSSLSRVSRLGLREVGVESKVGIRERSIRVGFVEESRAENRGAEGRFSWCSGGGDDSDGGFEEDVWIGIEAAKKGAEVEEDRDGVLWGWKWCSAGCCAVKVSMVAMPRLR